MFPSLDKLLAEFGHLAQSYPAQVAFFSYGQSQSGEPLWALRVGDGPQRVLAYAFPQPDEPLGGLALLHLAQRLLQDVERLRAATWTLLPCVDPTGARRNEGWFCAPLDLGSYARHHFRPPEGEQVEWSFPSTDPAWPWDRPLPEACAMQALLEEFRPQVLFPLHNSLLSGAYAFLLPDLRSLAAELTPLWEARGLATHQGEPELPFAAVLAPGVYRLPTLAELAAALSAQGVADPAGLLQCGAPAYLYARRYGEVMTVVPELPLFTVPGIWDTRPAGLPRRQVLEEALSGDRATLVQWSELYDRAVPLLRPENPYRSALEYHRRSTPVLLGATARWLESDPGLARPATVAELVDSTRVAPYLRLLPLGLLQQALAAEAGVGSPSVAASLEQVSVHLEQELAGVVPALGASPAPVDVLVQVVEDIVRWVTNPHGSGDRAWGSPGQFEG